MTDPQARARVWTRCLAALVLAALTGPLTGLLTPLAQPSSPALYPYLASNSKTGTAGSRCVSICCGTKINTP